MQADRKDAVNEIDELLRKVGVLPESPIGRLVVALNERIERLEREILPQEPGPEFYDGEAVP